MIGMKIIAAKRLINITSRILERDCEAGFAGAGEFIKHI
jgi:hypothetical protein